MSPEAHDRPEPSSDAAEAAPEEFVGPPRPLALRPLDRRPRSAQRPPPARSRPAWPASVKIALAGIGGLLLVLAIATLVVQAQRRSAAQAAALAARQAIEATERAERERAAAAQQELAERQRRAEQQAQERAERVREEQQRAEQARIAARDEAEKRRRAWEASYRPPPGCAEAASMACTNHYIRAKRAFDERYDKAQP